MSAAAKRMYHELNAIALELNSSALAYQNALDRMSVEKSRGRPRGIRHGGCVDTDTACDRGSPRRIGVRAAGEPDSWYPTGARCPRCGR